MMRAARLFDLIQIMRRHRRAVTATKLAADLGVSKRTIHRDIATLVALGAPIEGESGVGYLLRPGFLLPPLMLTEEELEALALGGLWVRQRGDPDLVEATENALAKIAAVLPSQRMVNLQSPPLMSAPAKPVIADAIDPKVLRSSIRRERKLRIRYAGDGKEPAERTIWPIALVYFDAVRILVGWCELRQDFRHFRTDRILDATTLDQRPPQSRRLLLELWHAKEAASRGGGTNPVAKN